MPENDHRHCKVCGKVCAPGDDTCSKACRTTRAQQLRRREMYQYLIYATIAIIIVAYLSAVLIGHV